MTKPKLSVVVSAYNSADKLNMCLASVSHLADEIVVIDNSSTDATAKIARSHKARVFRRVNNPMLNVNKNYGFEKATGEWILNLDTDEEITKELKDEIASIVRSDTSEVKDGYWIPRKNIIFGKWIQYGLWWPDKHLRLFKKGKGRFACKHVHEYIEIEGELGELLHPFIHHNYDSISQYLSKLERYTTNESEALRESQYQLSWFDAIRFPLSDFLKVFFAQEAYKDGLHGIVLSLFQAFYSFVVFSKLWEMERFPQKPVELTAIDRELRRGGREFSYWRMTSSIKESQNIVERLILKIRRWLSV